MWVFPKIGGKQQNGENNGNPYFLMDDLGEKQPYFWVDTHVYIMNIWLFPKIVVPPNHPFVHRVFHYFHHPFWGFSPYFWFNTHIYLEFFFHLDSLEVATETKRCGTVDG